MKKCKYCATIQNDSRTTCVECGRMLGHPMSAAEEDAVNEALDDQLNDYAERADDFYVPLRDKIMGVLCIIGIVAAVLLLNFVGTENKQLKADAGVIESGGSGISYVTVDENGVATMHTGGFDRYFPRSHELDSAGMYALFALTGFIAAAPMLFFPRFMWMLDTLKYRLFYNWDTTPSDLALIVRKVFTYGFFVLGAAAMIYGYVLFL